MKNETKPTRKWTVMVYLAGQNRLFDEMVYALKEMKRVAPPTNQDVALLAEFSAKWVFRKDVSPTKLATPRRFDLVTRRGYPAGSVARNFVDVDQRTPYKFFIEELAQFIWWGVKNYKAQHYMVVFSGDGGGVNSDFLPSILKPGRKIRAYDLTDVFRRVNKLAKQDIMFDIVGFDSCMMSMVEIGHGLRRHARYIVGSQGNEDDMGWPFAEILQPLTAHPGMKPIELATNTVDQYNFYYLDYALIAGASACLSAFRVDKMNSLAAAVRVFVREALALLPRNCKRQTTSQRIFIALLVHSHWVAQTFRQDQFTDLYDFCDCFVAQARTMMKTHARILRQLRPVVEACEHIKEVICQTSDCDENNGSAVVRSCSVGSRYQYSHGISIYFPWNRLEEHYYPGDKFEHPEIKPDYFGIRTGWSKFIERYIECSQRPRRHQPESLISKEVRKILEILGRDPPEGKGPFAVDPEPAKNPPTKWDVSPCVIESLRPGAHSR